MCQQDRLSLLEVGVTGKMGVTDRLGGLEQCPLQALNERHDLIDRGLRPQTEVGGHLVVAAPTGVELRS